MLPRTKNPFSAILSIYYTAPVSMCGSYYVDSFEIKVDVNIAFICEDIKEKVKIFFVGGRKNVF